MDAHQKINNLIKNPIRYSSTQEYPGGIFFIINSSRTSVRQIYYYSPLRDATEKVLILRKAAQDKVYLYVLRYYILYIKTVFQWRPIGGEKQAGISGGSQSNQLI